MSLDLRSGDHPHSGGPAQSDPIGDLVIGYLHDLTPRNQDVRLRDLDPWFKFCEDFGVDVLMATRHLVIGYARYLYEVLDESPEVVKSRLGTLSAFYDHALEVGAVGGNPVPG